MLFWCSVFSSWCVFCCVALERVARAAQSACAAQAHSFTGVSSCVCAPCAYRTAVLVSFALGVLVRTQCWRSCGTLCGSAHWLAPAGDDVASIFSTEHGVVSRRLGARCVESPWTVEETRDILHPRDKGELEKHEEFVKTQKPVQEDIRARRKNKQSLCRQTVALHTPRPRARD